MAKAWWLRPQHAAAVKPAKIAAASRFTRWKWRYHIWWNAGGAGPGTQRPEPQWRTTSPPNFLPGKGLDQVATSLQEDSVRAVWQGLWQGTWSMKGGVVRKPQSLVLPRRGSVQRRRVQCKHLTWRTIEQQRFTILGKKLITLHGKKRDGKLVCSKEELDLHMKNTLSDPNRQTELGLCDILVEPPLPNKNVDIREPLLNEVQEILRKARFSSAPGPSGVLYKVYKHFHCYSSNSGRSKSSGEEGRWHSSGDDLKVSGSIKRRIQRRSTSSEWFPLLSMEGKIFFSVVARQLSDVLSRNNYIDMPVQQGRSLECLGA